MLSAKSYVDRLKFLHSLVHSDDGYGSLIRSNNETGE